jgi:predicted RNA-binding Zn ribbon-like protein
MQTIRSPETPASPPFRFVGGHPCLEFVNTRLILDRRLTDLLRTFGDLVEWLAQAGLVDREQAAAARARWQGTPGAEQALQAARALRDVLEQMVQQIASGQEVPGLAVEAINRLLRDKQGYVYVAREGTAFVTRFARTFPSPEHLLIPIAESAADFLTRADFSRVKKCENPRCVRYLYDTSRNHSRRWCDMSLCGNRLKAARHSQRRHPA